jgi:hypothetical protein
MASIPFDDGLTSGGEVILQADDGLPTARFNNWIPDPEISGETAENPGGRVYSYEMGRKYRAKFEMPRIPEQDEELVARFKLHAENGGFFDIVTDDVADRTYTDCQLVKGTKVGIRRDRDNREMTLILHVINQSIAPTHMICIYST